MYQVEHQLVFSVSTSNIFIFPRYISTNKFNDQLPVGLLALNRLVKERCKGIAKVTARPIHLNLFTEAFRFATA